MWCLCGKKSIYTWRNKLVPLEAWVGRAGEREDRLMAPDFREEVEQALGKSRERGDAGVSWARHHLQGQQLWWQNLFLQGQELLHHKTSWASHVTLLNLSFSVYPKGE